MATGVLFAAVGWAQEFRATLSGVVTDASGASLSGAQVSVAETSTNVRSTAIAEQNGHYAVPFLLPGDYEIVVNYSGFKQYRRKGVRVSAWESPVVDVKLEVGEASQSAVVTAEAPGINVENGSVGTTITAKEVENLPLNGSTNNPGDYVYSGDQLNLNSRNLEGPAFYTGAFRTLATEQFQFHVRTFATTFPSLRADGTNDMNVSLMKDFRFGDALRFQLRGESYNVMNHPFFGAPNTQVNNSLFGYITSQANRPRSVQLMVRMMF